MNKNTKIILLIVVAAVLCAVLVWGIAIRNVLFLPFGRYFESQNNGQGVKQTQFEVDPQGIQTVYLDFVSEQISVVATNEDKIRIEETSAIQMDQKDIMQSSVNGDTVVVSSGLHDDWFNVFRWARYGDIKVTLYIPSSYKNNLGLHTVSGEINAQDFKSGKLKVDTTSGRISASNIQASTADVSSTSGEIILRNFQAGGMDIHETSGAITLNGGSFDSVTVRSVSGAVMLDAQRMGKIDAGSTSGSLNISAGEMPVKIDAGTVSGSVMLKLPENGGFTLKALTTSGSVNNGFAMANGVYKSGGSEINLSSVSGSINIIQK